ncbi:hypothetical protein OAS86_01395 [Gammaproteobacteria bacterium]|nr:hypothetical protein [Gammaproteobacteria bacterium]
MYRTQFSRLFAILSITTVLAACGSSSSSSGGSSTSVVGGVTDDCIRITSGDRYIEGRIQNAYTYTNVCSQSVNFAALEKTGEVRGPYTMVTKGVYVDRELYPRDKYIACNLPGAPTLSAGSWSCVE